MSVTSSACLSFRRLSRGVELRSERRPRCGDHRRLDPAEPRATVRRAAATALRRPNTPSALVTAWAEFREAQPFRDREVAQSSPPSRSTAGSGQACRSQALSGNGDFSVVLRPLRAALVVVLMLAYWRTRCFPAKAAM